MNERKDENYIPLGINAGSTNIQNQKVCKKKNPTSVFCADRKFHPSGSVFCITWQSLVMPNSDPPDGIFYPYLTLM